MPVHESGPRQSFIVTGSSGFIGSHLCANLCAGQSAIGAFSGIDVLPPPVQPRYRHITADLTCMDDLHNAAGFTAANCVVFHLAASAEVLTPWAEVPALLASNLTGTYNMLEALRPHLVMFASSSSVYGSAGLNPVSPGRDPACPLSLYAISKLSGEMLLRDWARASGHSAVAFRFGNVIGPGCRGLVRYLANHIIRYPEGGVVARLRAGGRLVRDYVPVDYVVRVLMAGVHAGWHPGELVTLNLGTGRGMSNRDIAEIVQHTAAKLGLRLDVSFDDPPGAGEAGEVVLDMEETVNLFGIAPPGYTQVRDAVADAVRDFLNAHACTGHTRTVPA